MYYTVYNSPIGQLHLYGDDAGLAGLWFSSAKSTTYKNELHVVHPSHKVFAGCTSWLDEYFSGKNPSPGDIALNYQGTVFQKSVWAVLLSIPYGTTMTYGDVARRLCNTTAEKHVCCRAIGQAVGANPISIIIPCHRVIGKNGRLVGYAGGLDKKTFLLQHECVNIIETPARY